MTIPLEPQQPAVAAGGPGVFAAPEPSETEVVQFARAELEKDLKGWAVWLGIFGAVGIAVSGIADAGSSVLLLGLAGMSLRLRHPAMFPLLGTGVVWVALNNLSGGGAGLAFGVFQLTIAWSLFGKFKRFTGVEQRAAAVGLAPLPGGARAAVAFPWTALGLGVLTPFLMLFSLIGSVVAEGRSSVPVFVMSLSVNLAVFAIGLAVASLCSRFPKKAASIVALIPASLVLIAFAAMLFLVPPVE